MKRIFTTLIALLLVQSVFACSAGFGWYQSPTSTSALNVNFYNTSSYGTGSSLSGSAWIYYGDGANGYFSTATSSLSHAYASPGTYYTEMVIYVYDSSTSTYCTDSTRDTLTINYWPCASTVATSISGASVTFTATTPAGTAGMSYGWNFGDGTSGSGSPVTHTYAAAGTYAVSLVATSTSGGGCMDSAFLSVTIGSGAAISGYLIRDSLTAPVDTADYTVWLITYDSATHIIKAVDSQNIITPFDFTTYSFAHVLSGSYLVKAAITNGPSSGTGYVPTYHDSSAYWSGAAFIAHSASATTYVNVWMQHGTVTSGPGFVAGNVLYGAGKTTGTVGAPVKGLLVMLRDSKNNIVASTYTDASGNYKISNLPYGTYSIYPEAMGFKTTPWTAINVTSTTSGVNGINFTQNSTSIKPGTSAVPNIAAADQKVTIYPNPTSGKLTIQWDANAAKTAAVHVTNIAGQTVYSTQLNIDGVDRSEINLTGLNTGLYFMNIISGEMNYTQKVSIQH
jgi:hypothetical protein